MIGYLGLGSNVGDRRAQLERAVAELPLRVLASSSTYDTDPVGGILDQPAFLNACVRIESDSAPEALLDLCKQTERAVGRKSRAGRHAPREIDIDLLLFGGLEFDSDRLTLPHEQVLARRFVLIPLLELDWNLRTPAGQRLSDALAVLPLSERVRLAGPPIKLAA